MRVVVRILYVRVVDMRVRMGLPIVAVIVFVLHVLMIVQNVRVGMGNIIMRVLMGVLCCGHCL
ncbi:MAG: hypothetical protein WCB57_03480, partial [Pseudonocardiaceae bacterium]